MPPRPRPARRHLLILGDQLHAGVGPLADADPSTTTVVLVQSEAWARRRHYHRHKLILVFSAMHHFAAELQARGFDVREYRVDAFEDGLARHLSDFPGARLELMEPPEHGLTDRLRRVLESLGGELTVVPNALWLSSDDAFDAWVEGRRSLRLEHWYREERRRTGWLMTDDGQPEGGAWNLDRENRKRVPAGMRFPASPSFPPDATTREVSAWVDETFPELPGRSDTFDWPVTRSDALIALADFVEHRLHDFGPYQDAMVDGERSLFHSRLSTAMNVGLISAEEACLAALDAYRDAVRSGDPERSIPLSSIEGYLRQLLGWREFLRHVYRRRMPEMAEANALDHRAGLPGFYWTGDTGMRCLAQAVDSVLETGHAHHIQRLMVLGNWALLAGVDPREVDEWFLALFVDAFDWVVIPNVMGMSQWADQTFTSKPYVSGGAYIDRMSDHCRHCRFDPGQSSGPDACPFSSLYWDFVDRHADRLGGNARMGNAARSWRKRDKDARAAILERAREVKELAARDQL